jgi:hypothetical protein
MILCRDVDRRSLHFLHPIGGDYHQSWSAKCFPVPKLVPIATDELGFYLEPFQVDAFFSFEFLFKIQIMSHHLSTKIRFNFSANLRRCP